MQLSQTAAVGSYANHHRRLLALRVGPRAQLADYLGPCPLNLFLEPRLNLYLGPCLNLYLRPRPLDPYLGPRLNLYQ